MKLVHQLLLGAGAGAISATWPATWYGATWTQIATDSDLFSKINNSNTLKRAIQALRNPNDNATWDLNGYTPSKY